MPTTEENKLNSKSEELEEVQENINSLWRQIKENQRLSSRPIFNVEAEENKLKELMSAETDWRKKVKLAAKIISIKL